jgi:WD40 repeat protein
MGKMKLELLLVFLVILLFAGCTNETDSFSEVLDTPEVSSRTIISTAITKQSPRDREPAHRPDGDLTPTETHTPVPTITPTLTPDKCARYGPSLTGDFLASGTLAFRKTPNRIDVLSTEGEEPKDRAPGYFIFPLSMSPYTGTIVLLNHNDYKIMFIKSDGTEHIYDWHSDDGFPKQWLPQDRLVLEKYDENEDYLLPARQDINIISVETGEMESHEFLFWKYFDFSTNYIERGGIRTVQYHPDLKSVIYAYRESELGSESGVVLWSIEEERVLWKGELAHYANWIDPNWKLSGESVVVNLGNIELFAIGEDGTAAQLTHLQELVNKNLYVIRHPKWSPNGAYVAFLYVNPETSYPFDNKLLLLDVASGELLDYCLPGTVSDVTWSMDSSQIAFLFKERSLAVFNIPSREVRIMEDVVEIYGWYTVQRK